MHPNIYRRHQNRRNMLIPALLIFAAAALAQAPPIISIEVTVDGTSTRFEIPAEYSASLEKYRLVSQPDATLTDIIRLGIATYLGNLANIPQFASGRIKTKMEELETTKAAVASEVRPAKTPARPSTQKR